MQKTRVVRWLCSVILAIFTAFCFVACGGEDDKKEKEYVLTLTQTEFEIEQGETFTVPAPTVTPSLKGGTVSWNVSFGETEVAKTADGNGFVADMVGVYTIVYSPVGFNAPSAYASVTCVKKLRETAAPADVSVNENGVITFKAEENRTYKLYLNGEDKGAVQNGENIKGCLSVGETTVSVKVAANVDAKESPLSTAFTIKKCAPAEISVADGKLAFDSQTGEKYMLYISGVNKGEVQSGASIEEYIIDGTNDFYVVVTADGAIDSEKSNVFSLVSLAKINDFTLNADETVSFTERYGFAYALLVNGEEKGAIENGSNLSPFYANLGAGENEFSLKATATAENCFVSQANAQSNVFTKEKLVAPVITSVAGEKLTFTAAEGVTVNVFVDGENKGEVQSGASLLSLYTANETMQIALVATQEGKIPSELSESTTVNIPEVYRLIEGNVTYGSSYTYSDKTTINGVKITAKEGESAKIVKPVPFSGNLLKFSYCNYGGDYQIGLFIVRFTDVKTNEKLDLLFTMNSDVKNADAVYLGWSYKGNTIDKARETVLSLDMSDNGAGSWFGVIQPKEITIAVDEQGFLFTPGAFANNGWSNRFTGATALDLTGFGTEGVYIDLFFERVENDEKTASVMVGYHAAMPPYTTEADVTHTYKDNSTITGTKYNLSKANTPISIAKNKAFSGELISFGYVNVGGNYQIKQFTVRITDVTTKKSLEIIFLLNVDAVAADTVYVGWAYDGKSGAVISLPTLGVNLSDHNAGLWYSNAVPRTIGLSVGTDGNGKPSIEFNNGFMDDWSKYFKGDKALDLTGFGSNGVDIEVEIDEFYNATEASFIVK